MSTDPAAAAYDALAAYEALDALAGRLAELRRRLQAGYRTESTHTTPGPDQLAARGAQHHQERADALAQMAANPHAPAPIGTSPAPLDLTLLDTTRDIELDLADLEGAVIDRVAPALTPAAGTQARILRIKDLLGKAAQDADLARHVAAEARRLTQRAAAVLGEHEPPVRLTTIRCPLCDCLSLRLRQDADLVECFNPKCTCVDFLCGCTDVPRRTRHQWPATHWPDLATKGAA
ncbi:hypothetical protein [Streptomonospora wellingtoniae]|uniref:Uncharacterized protein n=1 Tax=Streptomonospora wellingtoniae TaxID=3075544 RepID=A0ABU2L170_9ACTN|nr:hypothetical protein [Streptomonospora sp. DSM 45055]MDT0305083.1 hypothetical protein [Streptomonospora sp. DSM 45055]